MGEIIAHWDDDDYSAPGRLTDQVERLIDSGLSVTAYRSMKFTDGHDFRLYLGTPLYALGTSLCYRKDWWSANRFRSLQIAEDFWFADAARGARQLTSVDGGELMYATVHPSNTSPRQWTGASWRQIL